MHPELASSQDYAYEDFFIPSQAEVQKQFDNALQFPREAESKREAFITGMLPLPEIE